MSEWPELYRKDRHTDYRVVAGWGGGVLLKKEGM